MIPRCISPALFSIASASERHRALVADAIAALGMPVFGAVPREAALALPERHLGLVQAGEHADLAALIDRLAAMAERHLDLDAMIAKAAPLRLGRGECPWRPLCRRPASALRWRTTGLSASSIRILSMHGAVPARRLFRSRRSPTSRRPSTPIVAGCPAAIRSCMPMRLPRRIGFKSGLRRFAETRPVHGECGGYMVLGESLEDAAGQAPRHGRIARPRDELRQAQIASRLPHRAAVVRHCLGQRRARSCAATNSITPR